MAAEFNNLTGGAGEIPHPVWTEAFCDAFGEDGRDLAEHYETIFRVLDNDKNDTITVCLLSLPSLFHHVMTFTFCVR